MVASLLVIEQAVLISAARLHVSPYLTEKKRKYVEKDGTYPEGLHVSFTKVVPTVSLMNAHVRRNLPA